MRRPPTLPTFLAALAGGALIAAAAPAARGDRAADEQKVQAKLAARLAGYTPGRPTDCLINYPDVHTTGYGSRIVYEVNRHLLYVNQTTGGCEGLANGDILVTDSEEGRPCRGDIARTFEPVPHVPTGSCALGAFTPYERK